MLRSFPGVAVLLFTACATISTHAASAPVVTPIAAENFSYANNVALSTLNGGTGWTSAWLSDSPSFSDFRTASAGLTYPALTTAGGRIQWVFGGSQLNDAARTLPLTNSGVVFLQFLAQFGAQSGGGTPNFRLSAAGVQTGAIGGNSGCGSAVYSILDNTLGNPACSNASLGALSLVVVQIDYTTPTTRMWVNPNLGTFDYLNPPVPQAQFVGLAPAFDRIAIYARTPAAIDEIRVFRVSPSPTPATTLQPVPGLSTSTLLALSGLLPVAAWARRRRASRL